MKNALSGKKEGIKPLFRRGHNWGEEDQGNYNPPTARDLKAKGLEETWGESQMQDAPNHFPLKTWETN